MNKNFLLLVIVIVALGIGGYAVYTSPRASAPASQEKFTEDWDGQYQPPAGAWDGYYQVSYTGECNKPPLPRSPIFVGTKYLDVLGDKITEIDGTNHATGTITNDRATVIRNVMSDNQETSVFEFSHDDDDSKIVTVSFRSTAGCYGTGTGKQVTDFPSTQK